MTALFAVFLLLALALAAATAFSAQRVRPRLKWALIAAVLLCWISLGVALAQIAARTASTLVTPGAARRMPWVEGAAREALTLLFSLGGPALLVTALGWLSLRWSRAGAAPAAKRPRAKPARVSVVRKPGKDLDEVRKLFEEYARSLDFDLAFQGFAAELAGLPGDYSAAGGALLLARVSGATAGCVALHGISPGVAEVKRLYVRPPFRHVGLGRQLAEVALSEAKRRGYGCVRLDTVPAMREAIALYRSLGFHEIPAYRDNPVPGALFLEKRL